MKLFRMAVWTWYLGGRYAGFQRQLEEPTVQSELERVLLTLGTKGAPMPAGRTDRGVHARMQVLSLKSHLSPRELQSQSRALLPPDIGFVSVRPAPEGFHAQWSCVEREYRYRLVSEP